MKNYSLFVLLSVFLTSVAQAQKVGRKAPPPGSSFDRCAEWSQPPPPVKDENGNLIEYPAGCVRWETCKEQIDSDGPALVTCQCYLGLTQSHPQWCADCDFPSVIAIGSGDSKEAAEEDARDVCNAKFQEVAGNKNPNRYDFQILNCRQKGRTVCEPKNK